MRKLPFGTVIPTNEAVGKFGSSAHLNINAPRKNVFLAPGMARYKAVDAGHAFSPSICVRG